MPNFNSPTLSRNIEITNQYLQQAGSALSGTCSSTIKLGNNILAASQSVVEAVQHVCNDYKYACSTISDNLPNVLMGVCTVSLLCPPVAYGTLANVATYLISHPIAAFTLHTAYNFLQRTDGTKNIQDAISSAGDVLSDSVQVVKNFYHASDSAINTVESTLQSYLVQGLGHDSEETNNEANINESLTDANQLAISISSVGDSLSEMNIEDYDIISTDEINEVTSTLSGVAE